jgi:hypothetical protein
LPSNRGNHSCCSSLTLSLLSSKGHSNHSEGRVTCRSKPRFWRTNPFKRSISCRNRQNQPSSTMIQDLEK